STGRLSVRVGSGKPLELPLNALAAVQFSPALSDAASKAFTARLAERDKTHDVLLIEAPEGVITFTGALEHLDADGWTFKIGTRTQHGDFTRAAAVVLAAGLSQPIHIGAVVRRIDGSQWPGQIESADAAGVTMKIEGGQAIPIAWSSVRDIAIRSE